MGASYCSAGKQQSLSHILLGASTSVTCVLCHLCAGAHTRTHAQGPPPVLPGAGCPVPQPRGPWPWSLWKSEAAVPGSQRARSGRWQWADEKWQPPCQILGALPTAPPTVAASARAPGKSSQRAPCGSCPSPGFSAFLRFSSEYPAYKVEVWLPQSNSGPTLCPQTPMVPPTTPEPLSDGLLPPPRATPTQQRSWRCPLPRWRRTGREAQGSRLPAPSHGHLGAKPA